MAFKGKKDIAASLGGYLDRLPYSLCGPPRIAAAKLRNVGYSAMMIIELWAWLFEKHAHWRWRTVYGATASNLLLVGVMGIMWWWMDGKLQDQRDNVSEHLSAEYSYSGNDDDNPAFTLFTVTNHSDYRLSGKHKLACRINLLVGWDGTSSISGVWEMLLPGHPNGQIGGVLGGSVAGILIGDDAAASRYLDSIPDTGTPLEAGGDAETNDCLRVANSGAHSQCIDMLLVFRYSLESQPDYKQEKRFRYVGEKEGAKFMWHSQPIESRTSYCGPYLKRPS